MRSSASHLGEMLVRGGLITEAQLAEAVREQRSRASHVPLDDILVERQFITRQQLDFLLTAAKQRPKLGELLVGSGAVTAAQLADALDRQKSLGVPLGQILIRLGYITDARMRQALALQMYMRVVGRMLDR